MALPAADALETLKAGNARFVKALNIRQSPATRTPELVVDAKPHTVILTCADARVPPEIIFDQNIGDLFVIRVAGNIAAPTQIGSIEFAARAFGVRLVVVLGHSGCAAISTTIDLLQGRADPPSPGIGSIIEHIRPAIAPVLKQNPDLPLTELKARAIDENCKHAASVLTTCPELSPLVESDSLNILQAHYCVESGQVTW